MTRLAPLVGFFLVTDQVPDFGSKVTFVKLCWLERWSALCAREAGQRRRLQALAQTRLLRHRGNRLALDREHHLTEPRPLLEPLLGLCRRGLCGCRTIPLHTRRVSDSPSAGAAPAILSGARARVPRWLRGVRQRQTMHHWRCQAELAGRLVTSSSGFKLAVPVL